ncbi:hypothetical protein [Desulfofalx alkaliphila]|uniref:hypothetical protein n=1 Tax=Desulfofalx alkaliphila TaxID=105483 RepID=UPI0004E1CB62|nr:hypothetical protein [Desulfofalx alkaliphila]
MDNAQWLMEFKKQYEDNQGKWKGGKPMKEKKENYGKALEHCRKKFKECAKYGKDADKCREYYKKRYMYYKGKLEQGKGGPVKDGPVKDGPPKKDAAKLPPKKEKPKCSPSKPSKKRCPKAERCLLKTLINLCQKQQKHSC